jgi:hypothetical protein
MIEASEDLPLLHKFFAERAGIQSGPQDLHGSFQPDTILNALGAIDHAEAAFADTFEQLPARHANAREVGREDIREGDFEEGAGPFMGCQHAAQLEPEIGVVRALDSKEVLAPAGRYVDGRPEKRFQPLDP